MLFKGSAEDFIYIIIGIIWLIFSIYKGSQKNKAKRQKPVETQPERTPERKEPATIFDSFLENLMKEEEQGIPYEPVEVKKEAPQPEIVETPAQEIFSYDDMAVERSYEYEAESNYFDEETVYEIPTVEQATELQHELKTHLKPTREKPRFDLRKAVIYSEILNRRYF